VHETFVTFGTHAKPRILGLWSVHSLTLMTTSLNTLIAWISLHWRIAATACAVAILATFKSSFESEECRGRRAERRKQKQVRNVANAISKYGSEMHRLYPTGDVIVSPSDLAERLRKRPEAVITALELLLKEQKVQRASLAGFWKLKI
jgi:hypothetical protein